MFFIYIYMYIRKGKLYIYLKKKKKKKGGSNHLLAKIGWLVGLGKDPPNPLHFVPPRTDMAEFSMFFFYKFGLDKIQPVWGGVGRGAGFRFFLYKYPPHISIKPKNP
jgi:hypothetical protein